MQLRYRSAVASISRPNAWEVDYTGVLSRDACLVLGRYVRTVTAQDSIVERLDRSLIVVSSAPFNPADVEYLRSALPGAIVCRPDQYTGMVNFCMALGAMGIKRLAFLDCQLAEAQGWCAQFAPVETPKVLAALH